MATNRKVSYVYINWDLLASYYPASGNLNLNHLSETNITNLKSVDIVSPVNITLTFNDNTSIICRVDSYGYLVATGYNFGKTLLVKGVSLMDDELDVLKNHKAVTMGGVKIYFYTRSGYKNKIDKTYLLSNEKLILGDFTESFNISELSLTLDYPIDVFNWTYCYIPQLKRYYFVTGKESISKQFSRITLSVDGLFSFKDLIMSQAGVISRSSINFDDTLIDTAYPVENKETIDYYNMNLTNGPLVNTILTGSGWGFALTCLNYICKKSEYYSGGSSKTINPPTGVYLPTISTNQWRTYETMTYLISQAHLKDFTDAIIDNAELGSFVLSVIALPFTPPNADLDTAISGTSSYLALGDTDVTNNHGTPAITYNVNSSYLVVADFVFTPKYTSPKRFLNYEPFSSYEIYLPFYGWIPISAEQLLNRRLLVIYVASYQDESGDLILYDYESQKIIFKTQIKIGQRIYLQSTNKNEVRLGQISAGLNMGLGMTNGFFNFGSNLASGNYAKAGAGFLGVVSSELRGLNQIYTLREKQRLSSGNPNTGNFGINEHLYVTIRHTYKAPLNTELTYDVVFTNTYGRPNNSIKTLSQFTSGYIEVGQIQFDSRNNRDITENEVNEIVNELRKGVYI